jgi:hypothetical protein
MQTCGLNINDVRNTLKGGKLINFEPAHGVRTSTGWRPTRWTRW